VFSHPTPHPPPVALLSLPLALFTYEQAVVIWFIFEIICVFLISYLLVDWWNAKRDWKHVLGWAFLMLGSAPFVIDIGFGQLSILLLLFLVFSWQSLRRGKEIVGGIFLGLVLALKLMAWPIVLYLLIKRRWRAVFSSGMVVILSNGFMLILMGLEPFISYYVEVGPTVSALYQGDAWNISVWGWGWSFFAGLDSSIAPFVKVSPLFESLFYLAPYAAIVCLLTVVSVGLYHALRLKEFDTAFGILVCVSILANPTAWSHYFTWAVIPLAILWRRLQNFKYPRVEFRLALLVTLLLAYSWRVLGWLVYALAYMPFDDTIAAIIGLATYLPTYVTFLLMALIARMGRAQFSHTVKTSMGEIDV
jgi:alpha-1,2-mannosyltransferase